MSKLQLAALSLWWVPVVVRGVKTSETPMAQCSIYIAPSTIPNAGLGIFTAKPLRDGDVIGYGDVLIPIVDFDLHTKGNFTWMLGEYAWEGSSCGITRESIRHDGVMGLGPGLDGAINCHLALINVDSTFSERDAAGVHRSTSPGAGAFSEYYNATTFAKVDIPAGGELFKFYGDHWFQGRTDEFGFIPLTDDYAKANELLRRFHHWFPPSESLSDDIKQSMFEFIKELPINQRILNALPSYNDIPKAVANGIESLHQSASICPIPQLESTGRCLDNIQPGRSTLKDAGRGAFATRYLPSGSVITGSPLLHIPYEEMLLMHNLDQAEENDTQEVDATSTRYQLLLNYCWGHAESTVLICPYGAGVNYINHNTSSSNVRIRWAPHGEISHNSTWLQNTSVNDMAREFSPKLAIDYVALSDIAPGEELFLDYGAAWEESWSRNVQRWAKQIKFRANYSSATQYNLEHATSAVRTIEEQLGDPYPDNLELRCHHESNSFVASEARPKVEWTLADVGYECDVLARIRFGDNFVYNVTIRDTIGGAKNVSGLTRDFLLFLDRPYTTDMHLPWAFRHKMMLPDDMVPQIWRNIQFPFALGETTKASESFDPILRF